MNDIGKILNYLYFLFWHKALLYVNISERGVESIHNILCVVYVDNSRYFETGGNRWGPHIPQGNIYLTALKSVTLNNEISSFFAKNYDFPEDFYFENCEYLWGLQN